MMSTATTQAAILEQREAPFCLLSVPRLVPGPGQAVGKIIVDLPRAVHGETFLDAREGT